MLLFNKPCSMKSNKEQFTVFRTTAVMLQKYYCETSNNIFFMVLNFIVKLLVEYSFVIITINHRNDYITCVI